MLIPKLAQLVRDNAEHLSEYRIEAKGDDATVYAYGVIGGAFGGIDEAQFARDLSRISAKNIALRINSPGGDVFAARAMMTALANHPATVTAHVDGVAASAATSLMMAANRIEMSRGARLMIHNAWSLTIGDKRDHAAQAELLAGMDRDIAKDYSARTGKSESELASLMDAETWFNADEAKAAGFVDSIVETTKAANKWNLSAYANAPADLQAETKTHLEHLERRLSLLEKVPA